MNTPQIGAILAFLISLAGCSEAPPTQAPPSPVGPTAITPNSETKPRTDWSLSAARINPMDNVSTQFVSTGYIIKLMLCFENGKPCGHGNAPVFVTSPCWIEGDEPSSHHRTIRVKFDDSKALAEHWGITDDHKGLTPPDPGAFVADLKKHKTLMVEFGCDRSDPGEVIALSIQGLQEALDSAHLKVSSAPPFANLDQAVKVASDTYRLDPDLLSSVLNAGTEFNVPPISPQGAAQHLRELLDRYDFDLIKALAAYKVGQERVEQYFEQHSGIPPETSAYVAHIVRDFNKKADKRSQAKPPQGKEAAGPSIALLNNGFSISYKRKLLIGSVTRLYISDDEGAFVDIPTNELAALGSWNTQAACEKDHFVWRDGLCHAK